MASLAEQSILAAPVLPAPAVILPTPPIKTTPAFSMMALAPLAPLAPVTPPAPAFTTGASDKKFDIH